MILVTSKTELVPGRQEIPFQLQEYVSLKNKISIATNWKIWRLVYSGELGLRWVGSGGWGCRVQVVPSFLLAVKDMMECIAYSIDLVFSVDHRPLCIGACGCLLFHERMERMDIYSG